MIPPETKMRELRSGQDSVRPPTGHADLDMEQHKATSVLQDTETPACRIDAVVTLLVEKLIRLTYDTKTKGAILMRPAEFPEYKTQRLMQHVVGVASSADFDFKPEMLDEV